jgi:alpha-amylase
MAMFRNVVGSEEVKNWWDNNGNQIAFSRGESGFIAINNENFEMNTNVKTSMAPGDYCDVISGNKKNSLCTGKIITIRPDGTIQVKIGNNEEDPIIAIHKESKII